MTQTPPLPSGPRAGFSSLLGLGIVLLVMAATCIALWVLGTDSGPSAACIRSDSTYGDCLVHSEIESMRAALFGQMSVPLVFGGVTALLLGAVQAVTRRPR